MKVFAETQDPSETKDYTYDWSSALAADETIQTQTATLVVASGATKNSDTNAGAVSRVWLSGGTSGSRIIFTIRILTNQARTLEESFGVDVLDSTLTVDPGATVEQMQIWLATAREQRHLVALGEATVEIMRNGRRVVRKVSSLDELNKYILVLEREISQAQAVVAGRRRRRGIALAWPN